MICNKDDLKYYLQEDKRSLNIISNSLSFRFKQLLWPDEIYKFERILRFAEYYSNVKPTLLVRRFIYKLMFLFYRYRLKKQSLKMGFTIPCNVFGPGLSIAHYGTIIVNESAKIGKNCRIHASVNIGASAGNSKAPVIGDNAYIGPGAIIYGDIVIGDNVSIGANATVNKSFNENNILLAGTPASIIKTNMKSWMAK